MKPFTKKDKQKVVAYFQSLRMKGCSGLYSAGAAATKMDLRKFFAVCEELITEGVLRVANEKPRVGQKRNKPKRLP